MMVCDSHRPVQLQLSLLYQKQQSPTSRKRLVDAHDITVQTDYATTHDGQVFGLHTQRHSRQWI